MGAQIKTGPDVSSGNLNTSQITDSDCGPDLAYQGVGIVDPRYSFDITGKPGRFIRGFGSNVDFPVLDGAPQAPTAAGLVAAATVAVTTTASAAVSAGLGAGFISANLTLLGQTVPGSGNIAANVPLVPFGLAAIQANVVTIPQTLEFGFAFGSTIATTVAASPTLTLATAANAKYFYAGQPLLVAGAGNAGGTIPLMTTVVSVSLSAGTVTMANNALATLASGTQVGAADPALLTAFPYQKAGIEQLWDPVQAFARVLRVVNTNAADTGYSLIVRGYDIAGVPMTETIAVSANATAYGKKAWKYITQMNLWRVSSTTTTGTIAVGTGDVFGSSIRSDAFEYTTIYWAQLGATAAPGNAGNGWVAADDTIPATGTTGDVRGTIQVSAAGAGANTYAGGAPNGSRRLVALVQSSIVNAATSTNLNYNNLLGVPQYAG